MHFAKNYSSILTSNPNSAHNMIFLNLLVAKQLTPYMFYLGSSNCISIYDVEHEKIFPNDATAMSFKTLSPCATSQMFSSNCKQDIFEPKNFVKPHDKYKLIFFEYAIFVHFHFLAL